MTHTEILLLAAILAGFLLLLVTVGAFAVAREGAGVALLLLAAATFVVALVLMGRVSGEWEHHVRQEVLAKYRVKVQEWGAPLGSSPEWKVDGRKQTDCDVDLADPDDPVFECHDQELPLR